MSFFNLTMLGYNNQIKEYHAKDDSFLPPIRKLDSNLKFNQLRTKHVRIKNEPHQTYKRPLTCANEVGWWTKDEPIRENLKWSYVKRNAFPKSEMTADMEVNMSDYPKPTKLKFDLSNTYRFVSESLFSKIKR